MFRTTVWADEHTDIVATIAKLRSDAQRAGVAPQQATLLVEGIESTLHELVTRGRAMVSAGSQISAERIMTGEGYEVRLAFGAGKPKSLIRRLVGALTRR